MCNVTSSFNSLVDSHSSHQDVIASMQAKIADLEDRSRRNNLKLRGVPEDVQPNQLPHFAKNLFLAVLPSLSSADLTIDRIHRVPKPSFLPAETPRDVLMRIHFFQVKESILSAFRQRNDLPPQAANLQVLPDLSQFTLQRRRNLSSITKALRNHKIIYRWKYPAKLEISHNGSKHFLSSLEEGIRLLRSWSILPEVQDGHGPAAPPPPPTHLRQEWHVSYKKGSTKSKGSGKDFQHVSSS